uniref:Calmodulin n=1 Tax=Plectus sambesii TaxID=2011161 RepID=A0A914XBS6_9BILA
MTQMAANPPLLAQSNNVGWRHEIDVIGSGGPTSNPIATLASAARSSASSTSTASNHQFHSSPAATSTTTSKSQLHVTTVTTDGGQNISSIYSPNSSASRFSDLHSSTNMTASDLRSPTSFQTRTSTSSYRSPTKWTHFENEDSEFDEDDGDHSKPGVSSDTETRNLLEADACSPEPDDSDMLFVPCEGLSMTTQQRAYYTNCFVRLLKDTQSTTDVTYALRGSHERVMDFFEKSGLDKEDLSRVWNLTDVNEDGWLNLGEFCAAMHIIVLHIK